MPGLTRRQFLKRTGLIGAAFAVPPIQPMHVQPVAMEMAARAFTLTAVYPRPDVSSRVIGQLAPDSLHTVMRDDDWYKIDGGYVLRTAMQPIVPYIRPAVMDEPGFWAELIAPVTAIRKWCAAHAPIVTRLGFGAVIYVMDRVVDGAGQVWYGLSATPESALVGWSPALQFAGVASHFTPLSAISEGNQYRIRIDTHQSVLWVYDQGVVIAEVEIYSPVMQPAKTELQAVHPGSAIDVHTPLGLPWLMQLGSRQQVHGAFWHNRFGSVSRGEAIELLPLAARYLYGLVPNPVAVEIV